MKDLGTLLGRIEMNIKIAVITTEFLRDFVRSSLRKLNIPFEYSVYSYSAFQELSDIYLSLPDDVSGVMTSGFFPCEILRRSFPESNRIIMAFNNDHADIFKLLFDLIQSNRALVPERVQIDLLSVLKTDLPDYLASPLDMSLDAMLDMQGSKSTLDELLGMQDIVMKTHLRLWERGLVDASATRFSAIVQPLRDAGVPVHFIYPNLPYLESVFKSAMQAMRLRRMQDNQAAAIMVSGVKNESAERMELQKAQLQRAITLFCSLAPMRLVARPVERGIEILVNRKSMAFLTDNFCSCKLQAFLRENLDFAVAVGYGLGETVHQARLNAIEANQEARLAPDNASCLINERNELICPLVKDSFFVVSRAISPRMMEIAKLSGLSSLTLQKIEAAITPSSRRITSDELAEKLSITKRSANRILSALRDCGAAQVSSVQRGTTRGRPRRVYQVSPM